MAHRTTLGLGGKQPLFPGRRARALTPKEAIWSIRRVTGVHTASEHSLRRSGAQFHTRMGLPRYLVEFLGRWGSRSILRYIGEAQSEQLASASATCNARVEETLSLRQVQQELESLVRRLVAENMASSGGTVAAAEPGAMLSPAVEAIAGHVAPAIGAVRPTGRGRIHAVVIGDASFPTDVWTTRCGWLFGRESHVRCSAVGVNCIKCLRYAAVGGIA